MKKEKINRGQKWDLAVEEVEDALVEYIEKETGEKIPPRDEVDISLIADSDKQNVTVKVTGKDRK